MKNKIIIFLLVLLLIVFVSIFFYIYNNVYFHSSNITHWASLATIFSGFFGSIFTFITVIILILTLRETQKNSIENINALNNDADNQKLDAVNMCCDSLKSFLDKSNIAFLNNENSFFDTLTTEWSNAVNNEIINSRIKESDTLINECIKNSSIYRYDEIENDFNFLHLTVRNIKSIKDDNIRALAISIFVKKITLNRIFWIGCLMANKNNLEVYSYLNFINVISIPENLHHNMMMNTIYAEE